MGGAWRSLALMGGAGVSPERERSRPISRTKADALVHPTRMPGFLAYRYVPAKALEAAFFTREGHPS